MDKEKNAEKVENKEEKDCIIDPKQQELDELNDRYKRVRAEFENYKKRSSKERETLYNSILGDIVEVFLPIVDNLENALKVETQDAEYKKGIELVLKQFKDVLKAKGVEEIPAVGETFDPSLHEAVSSIQDSEKNAQEIVQEYRKGYKIGSRVKSTNLHIFNSYWKHRCTNVRLPLTIAIKNEHLSTFNVNYKK